MKHFQQMVVVFGLGIGVSAAAEEPVIYSSYLLPHDYDNYITMMDGRDVLDIENLDSLATTRNMVEPLLLQAAVALSDCHCRIEIKRYNQHTPHNRTIIQVKNGVEITHGVAGFTDDSRYDEGIYLSDPILSAEDFYVGFYTHEDREDILSLSEVEELRELGYAVVPSWELDNRVLEENGLRAVHGETWGSLMAMINTGRADVILQPFINTEDLSFEGTDDGDRYIPIPGVKMHFGQGRHYFVSQTHPDGETLLAAINQGLEVLRQEGTLYRAMVNSGVINEVAEEFEVIRF